MGTYSSQDMQDVGMYLRGLLQIMVADNNLHQNQKAAIREYALDQGFDLNFIEESIEQALQNSHLNGEPPVFHSKAKAQDFLLKAAGVAVCDGLLHPLERDWLISAATKNGISLDSIQEILDSVPLSDKIP